MGISKSERTAKVAALIGALIGIIVPIFFINKVGQRFSIVFMLSGYPMSIN